MREIDLSQVSQKNAAIAEKVRHITQWKGKNTHSINVQIAPW